MILIYQYICLHVYISVTLIMCINFNVYIIKSDFAIEIFFFFFLHVSSFQTYSFERER